jgi:hypothetical protein
VNITRSTAPSGHSALAFSGRVSTRGPRQPGLFQTSGFCGLFSWFLWLGLW